MKKQAVYFLSMLVLMGAGHVSAMSRFVRPSVDAVRRFSVKHPVLVLGAGATAVGFGGALAQPSVSEWLKPLKEQVKQQVPMTEEQKFELRQEGLLAVVSGLLIGSAHPALHLAVLNTGKLAKCTWFSFASAGIGAGAWLGYRSGKRLMEIVKEVQQARAASQE